MAKKQNYNSFEPFNGITPTEQVKGQGSIETLEGGRYMPEPQKSKGRPKAKRETKKRVSLAILPSLYEDIGKIAYVDRESISEIVSRLLEQYAVENEEKIIEYDRLKK